MTIRAIAVITVLLIISAVRAWGADGPNLLRNGDFQGTGGWGGQGSDDKKEVAIVTLEGGGKALVLRRKQAEADVKIDQTVRLKPQTLYRLCATGCGAAQAGLRLRPYSSKDKDFSNLSKCWATSSAPFEASDKPQTMEFVFDSGLKVDSAAVSVYLGDPKQLGEFTLRGVSLTEMGGSKPAKDETVIAHIGDSITITSYLPFHQRVERVLQSAVEKEFPKLKVRQLNFGADGEYVKELLDTGRYEKTIHENFERIDIAIVRYGPNDSRHGSADDFRKQLDRLCEKMKVDYPGITILLGTGTDLFPVNEDVRRQYAAYWQASRDLAKEQSADLCRSAGDMHPSAKGVSVMADEEFKALREILAAKAKR